jgi:hypothetical protein
MKLSFIVTAMAVAATAFFANGCASADGGEGDEVSGAVQLGSKDTLSAEEQAACASVKNGAYAEVAIGPILSRGVTSVCDANVANPTACKAFVDRHRFNPVVGSVAFEAVRREKARQGGNGKADVAEMTKAFETGLTHVCGHADFRGSHAWCADIVKSASSLNGINGGSGLSQKCRWRGPGISNVKDAAGDSGRTRVAACMKKAVAAASPRGTYTGADGSKMFDTCVKQLAMLQ